jgi:hypothetical protein
MRVRSLPVVVALSALGSVVPGAALASPEYPGVVQEHLDMPCAPECTLCHKTSLGGVGTLNAGFGKTAFDQGLDQKSSDLLRRTLDLIEAMGSDPLADGDADAVNDVVELRQGRSPNEKGAGVLCASYGCGARVAPAPPRSGAAALIVAAGVVVLLFASRRS